MFVVGQIIYIYLIITKIMKKEIIDNIVLWIEHFFLKKQNQLKEIIEKNEKKLELFNNKIEETIIIKKEWNKNKFIWKDINWVILSKCNSIKELQWFIEESQKKEKKEIIELKRHLTLDRKKVGQIKFILSKIDKIKIKLDIIISKSWNSKFLINLDFNAKLNKAFFNKYKKELENELSFMLNNNLEENSENIEEDKEEKSRNIRIRLNFRR